MSRLTTLLVVLLLGFIALIPPVLAVVVPIPYIFKAPGAPYAAGDSQSEPGGTQTVGINNLGRVIGYYQDRTRISYTFIPTPSLTDFVSSPRNQGTYHVTTDTSYCPNGDVLLADKNDGIGAGGIFPVSMMGEYAGGKLAQNGQVNVPLTVCLKKSESFQHYGRCVRVGRIMLHP